MKNQELSRTYFYHDDTDSVGNFIHLHYGDVIMDAIASQITSLTIVYSIVYSDADQRKHQSSASLALVRRIHRGPVNSPHKWPVTRKMFPFDDVIMLARCPCVRYRNSQCGIGGCLWRNQLLRRDSAVQSRHDQSEMLIEWCSCGIKCHCPRQILLENNRDFMRVRSQ